MENYREIRTAEDFEKIGEHPNDNFKLMNDVSLSDINTEDEYVVSEDIGGKIDGNNKTVTSPLNIEGKKKTLFESLNKEGSIENLNIK